MNLQALLLAALAIFEIRRRSVESAVLNVYLPALMLIPSTYSVIVPHLPPTSCEFFALFPIICALMLRPGFQWKFQRTDFWLLSFLAAGAYSEYASSKLIGNGVFTFAGEISDVFLPYMLGKILLEEQDFRERFARRLVLLTFIIAVVAILEFIKGPNLFMLLSRRLLTGGAGMWPQGRYGFMRIQGPLPGAENAGMIFIIAIFLAFWLRFVDQLKVNQPVRKVLGLRRSTWVVGGVILGLVMTLSRGPQLGMIFGLLIARIGKAKNLRQAVIVTTVFCAVGFAVAKKYANDYTDVSKITANGETVSDTRGTAIYRRLAFEQYGVIAEKGGLFGWGLSNFPKVKGLESLDNQYLLLQVTRGSVGYWLYLIMAAEASFGIALAVTRASNPVDIYFYFCMAAALGGIWATISTVFVTGQTDCLLFLMYGWVQSLQQTRQANEVVQAVPTQRFAFKRVFA